MCLCMCAEWIEFFLRVRVEEEATKGVECVAAPENTKRWREGEREKAETWTPTWIELISRELLVPNENAYTGGVSEPGMFGECVCANEMSEVRARTRVVLREKKESV